MPVTAFTGSGCKEMTAEVARLDVREVQMVRGPVALVVVLLRIPQGEVVLFFSKAYVA